MDPGPTQLIHSCRSDFQTIEIHQTPTLRFLRTDNNAIQSALLLNKPEQLVLAYMRAMMMALLFQSAPKKVLLLGLGGGDLVRYLHHHLPQSEITAVDIDAQLIEICNTYFALPVSERLHLHTDDALHFLKQETTRYDLLLVDIYSGISIPSILQQEDFYQCCYQHLQSDGILVLNLLTSDANQFKTILWMIRQCFDCSTLCLSVPEHINILIFAFRKRPDMLTSSALLARAEQIETDLDINLTDWVEQLFISNPAEDGKLIF